MVQVQTRERTQNLADTTTGEPQIIRDTTDHNNVQMKEQETELLNTTAQIAELEPKEAPNLETNSGAKALPI